GGTGGDGGSGGDDTTTSTTVGSTSMGGNGGSGGDDTNATATMTSNTTGSSGHCLSGWRDTPEGENCLNAPQGDQRECELVLDCYLENDCGPSDSCASANGGECHGNQLGVSGAAFQYADLVWDALC